MKIFQFLIIGFLSMVILIGCGVTDEDEGVIKIKNNTSSDSDIKDIYIRRSNLKSWGSDKLHSEELEPGESKKYTLDKCDRDYDFKVVYLNDHVEYEKDFYIGCYTKRTLTFKD